MQSTDFRRKFGRKIKDLRIQRELTQEQFAERVGLTSHQISAIERGVSSTKLWSAWLFAENLDVDFWDLFDWLPPRKMSGAELKLTRALDKLRKRAAANEVVTLSDLGELIAALNQSSR